MEVMDSDETPNILCREQTFFMNILKPCFTVQKDNSAVDMTTPVPNAIPPEAHEVQSENNTYSEQIIPVGEPNPVMKRTEKISSSHSGITDLAPNTALSASVLSVHSKPTETTLMKESVLKNYSDIFQGLGKFPDEPYKLRLKPDSTQAKHRPQKVPLHLQDAFHEEVKRLVEIDVLEPVNEPTEWVNSFVVVEKQVNVNTSNAHSPGHSIEKKIRLCIDSKDLNEALEQKPYYSRSIDELIAKFSGAVFFTIVDMDKGYWQVILPPESRNYTCMALDIGRFKWKQLPMGTVVASDIFQRKLDYIYLGLSGVTGIADDMVVYGRSQQEHDNNLIQYLETTRKNGLQLNKEKLQFKQTEVSFFGHLWSTKGISPDPKKIKSILEMNFPEDKETMHSFLGLVNFLNRYSPWLAELSSLLCDLIQKNAHYRITDIHKQAFASIKSEFSAKITLPYFSKDKETLLQTDASKKGFGAVLIQDNKPVYFESRTLTPSEKNYQNLKHECMAAVWGMEKFHYYLYGGHFTLQTDQKPRVTIFKKHLCDVSPRIQRIAICSWQYDFNTVWIKGKLNVIADAFSRVSPQDIEPNIKQESPIFTVTTLTNFQEGEEKMALMEETAKDPELSDLHKLISEGWPPKKSNVPDNLEDYWNHRDELTVENGILLKSHKFIVPKESTVSIH